jgi:hypothetical protein
MTEWIDFSLYAAMTAMYWFVSAGWASRLALQIAADRNEEWLADNQEQAAALLRGRWLMGSAWFMTSCYAWAAVSLAILLARQVGAWPDFLAMATVGNPRWEALKDVHAALLIAGLLYYFAVVLVSSRRVRMDVPVAERRQATLTPRTLNALVPRWLSTGTYALMTVHLGAWVVVGVLGLSAAPGFWMRFAAPAVFTGIFLLLAYANLDRRVSDALWVHDQRQGARFAFASLIYIQVMFALRLYGDVAEPSFDIDRVSHLVLALMLILAMVALVFASKHGSHGLKPALPRGRV